MAMVSQSTWRSPSPFQAIDVIAGIEVGRDLPEQIDMTHGQISRAIITTRPPWRLRLRDSSKGKGKDEVEKDENRTKVLPSTVQPAPITS